MADSHAFDVCVIGAGPGGFAGAMRAFDLGKNVCIVEGGEIGGTGVMWGALASKTMWELSRDYAIAAKVDRGYRASGLTVDYQAVRSAVMQAVKEKQYQMFSQIETYSPRRFDGPGNLTLKRGWASFNAPHSVTVYYPDNTTEEITATFFLIATGSKPRDFPHIHINQETVLNSDGVLNLKSFPRRLMIIGAGVIGCEYATIFSNFGQTDVFLVDHKESVIPYEDDDLSSFVNDNLEQNGVSIIHSASLKEIAKHEKHLEVVLDFDEGHSRVVEVDVALISIGRVANLSCLNLERIGIELDPSGLLKSDEYCCVRDHIYGAGDVTHHPALVNMAELEARYAVEHMFGLDGNPLVYGNMSTVMFFNPAVAAVGMNEKSCQKKNIPYRVAYYSNFLVNRAIAMRSVNGFVKIIATDDDNPRILGMRAAGPQVSSTIMSLSHLMDQDQEIPEVLKSLYPHPTITEGIQECLRLLLKKSVYKPRAFPEHIKLRTWHPETGFTDQ